MTDCAIVGLPIATAGQAVRVDVVVRGAPRDRPLRVRLERLWPDPTARVDERVCRPTPSETTTLSFLWRVPEPGAAHSTAVLRASVWTDRELCDGTHRVQLVAAQPETPHASAAQAVTPVP